MSYLTCGLHTTSSCLRVYREQTSLLHSSRNLEEDEEEGEEENPEEAICWCECRRHGFHPYQSEMNPFNPLNCIEYAFVHTDERGNVLREPQTSEAF